MQIYSQNKIHRHQFALWVGIASIIMMFGAFTSACIVRRAQGFWVDYKLPDIFFVNTLVILASSLTIQISFNAFKKGNERVYKSMMAVTFLLGLLFVVFQYQGWLALNGLGLSFTTNPSTSFLYVISGLHALHLIGGLSALSVALIHAFHLPFKPTIRRQTRFKLVLTYWHFVDILWVYLLIFFVLQS